MQTLVPTSSLRDALSMYVSFPLVQVDHLPEGAGRLQARTVRRDSD